MSDRRATFSASKIDVALVRRLVSLQFPQWADKPIRAVAFDGHDNRTFHLGDDMSVRLPSAPGYSQQVEKEHRWLPSLAPVLPLPITTPIALGAPGFGYPWNWSVNKWLDGENALVGRIDDLTELAAKLAELLAALHRADAGGGPAPGRHCFFRGGSLATYDDETRDAVGMLGDRIDAGAAIALWEAALSTTWSGRPVWVHGDMAAPNLLVRDGRLSAVIDFGCCAVGDPACDTVIAWTLFSGESRAAFRDTLALDHATWTRGRGWALWKALITMGECIDDESPESDKARRVIEAVLADAGPG